MFSDVMYEESTLVIPGTPELAKMQMSDTQQSAQSSAQSSKLLNCYISDAQMAVSSLLHSRASELWHQINVHDIVKVEANEKRSDPTNSSTLRTKWL